MVKQTAGQEFLLSTIIYFEHCVNTRKTILLNTIIYFDYYIRTAVGCR